MKVNRPLGVRSGKRCWTYRPIRKGIGPTRLSGRHLSAKKRCVSSQSAREHQRGFRVITSGRKTQQRRARVRRAGRVLLTGDDSEVPDVQADEDYNPDLKDGWRRRTRELRACHLMRNQAIVRRIMLKRRKPGRRFTERPNRKIVQAVADQAVIAIETFDCSMKARLEQELDASSAICAQRSSA